MAKKGEKVRELAVKLKKRLSKHSKKIEIAGSIRRKERNPKDIDIVLIPKTIRSVEKEMAKIGKYVQGGEKESTWNVEGTKVELYYTKPEEWGAMLMAYSGKRGSNIGLRVVARTKGFKLTRHGLFNRKTGKRIAGKTEKEIYKSLGREYKEPWER